MDAIAVGERTGSTLSTYGLGTAPNRDQLTGESRNSWGRSFDSQTDSEADTSTRDVPPNQVHHSSPIEFVESLVVKPDMTFKVLIVGNPHVGKSCFLMRLCTGTFTTRYASTIGVDFYSRSIRYNDQIVSLQLWDTAGQERFQSVTRAYYRGAHGVILMYDVTSEESFIAVKTWINSIKDNMQGLPTSLLLVGNKTDLDEYSRREVPFDVGETFAQLYNADFIETSAKTGFNVGHACLALVNSLVSDYQGSASVTPGPSPLPKKKKSCCQN